MQGFLELVERDAVALWWYNRVRLPAVDLDGFDEPYLGEVRAFLRKHGRDYWVLDATSDLGVPVFVAATRRTDGAAEQILFGFGAHLDARAALLRAVTEMNQMLGHVLHVRGDEPPGAHITDRDTVEWLRNATVANQPYLAPREGPPRTAASHPACRTDDIRDDVLACQALVEREGWRCWFWIKRDPRLGCRWSRWSCRGCVISGRALRRAGCTTCPFNSAGCRGRRPRRTSTPSRCFCEEEGVAASWVASLAEGAAVVDGAAGELVFSAPHSRLILRRPSPALVDALRRLAGPGEAETRLAESVLAAEGLGALARWCYFLQTLARRGFLHISAHAGDRRLATLVPTSPSFVFTAAPPPDRPYQLSRFAYTHRLGEQMVLESPLAFARVVLHDDRAAALVHALARPSDVRELGRCVPGLPADAAAPLLGLLAAAGMVEEDENPALQCWEFHDLLFHARSRVGRHDAPVGGTYRHAGRQAPPPALKPAAAGEAVELHRPDLGKLEREDPPFARVLEGRRSIREYASEAITDRQLGEFLFRVARVKGRSEWEAATPAGPVRVEGAARPYPAGGGLYELEVYVVVQAGRGLEPGLYHYEPAGHRLERLAGRTAEVAALLADAARSAGAAPEGLQVLLILASRFPRLAWKYASLAYALTLKHVGVVYQTMYLAATAMGLAPCALGGGDSDLFARAAGVDYYAETSVGEFLLGSKA